jgi:hypothetical protein
VLFVDISGSSRLYQELGDAVALQRVRGCLDMLHRVVEANGGRVVKNIGDGLMCEFPDADRALQSAEAMQIAVEDEEGESETKLGIHVGCHLGPVIESTGDLFGDTVNIAARVLDVARTGQIITTRETVERLSESLRTNVRLLDRVSVKGRRDAIAAFEYLWQSYGELTAKAIPVAKVARARLKIAFDGREVWLDQSGSGAINLGRDAACDVTVSDRQASRQHATIEVRGDKFVLVDHSSNGTYVSWEGAAETCLRREEMILPARGRIALGVSTRAALATRVEFSRER